VQSIRLGGVDRVAVLSGLLPGRKPTPPFTPGLYEREERAVARLHAALDDLRSHHPRPALDLRLLVTEPVRLALERLDHDDGARLAEVAGGIAGRITTLAAHGLDEGPCHGDVTFDNIHMTGDGQFGWLDFDSGGSGWRAIDLQGWASLEADTTALGAAFRAGYQSARPLPDADWAAAPWLTLAQDVWSTGVELRMRPDRQDPEATVEWLRMTTRTLIGRVDRLSGERA
jgi:Ser/Thr protein kinase RdoA (MazF antagonist)